MTRPVSKPSALSGDQRRAAERARELAEAATSRAATMMTIPANSARKPSWTTRRGGGIREDLGYARGGQQRDRQRQQRTPVTTADSPSATDNNNGTEKNRSARAGLRLGSVNSTIPAAEAAGSPAHSTGSSRVLLPQAPSRAKPPATITSSAASPGAVRQWQETTRPR
jgi:hypothetical protein